eukprot:GFKZ01008463.1.p1 GENE.GFKZ01008463.1~~GFKZ01008463.1.p1  ORF type:complete len:1473 (-),score=165.97 GFKZ01008463.1:182-4459(-)
MSSPPVKRPRLLSPSLHSKILSCFPQPHPHDALSTPSVPQLSLSTIPPTLSSLCDALTCVSKQSDPCPISTLQSHLEQRFHAPSELISALFFDPDSLPPLCALSLLIRRRLIRPIEIPSQCLITRAMLELETRELCSCRGVYPGVESLLRVLLDHGRVGERSFGALVAALFGEDQSGMDSPLRFKLARVVVEVTRKEAGEGGLADALLEEWAGHVVLPKRETGGDGSGRRALIWTPELSGLATGRKVSEYLKGGVEEEKAILALCRGVTVKTAIALFNEGVSVIVALADGKGEAIARGRLGAMFLLIERILDHGVSQDAYTSKTTLECSITAALNSVHAQGDPHVIALLLCLARRLFHPKGLKVEKEGDAQGFVEHERWLKNCVRAGESATVKAMVKALAELVALEPVQYLRTNHRVFSVNRQHLRQFGDYLVEVRGKISDLDPLHKTSSNGIDLNCEGTQLPGSESRQKAELDVSRFVSEFAQTGGKIPTSLVRQMNFHRYHFRGNTLPVLILPELYPVSEGVVNPFLDKRAFDEHRINLIKVMAFKRRDNAVTKEEAHTAISAIRAFNRNVKQVDPDAQAQQATSPNNSDPAAIQEFALTVEFVLKRSFQRQRKSLETNGMQNGEPAGMSETAVANILNRFKEELERRKEPQDNAALAAETLQGILDALVSCEQDDTPSNEESNDCEEKVVEAYQRWWRICGTVLRTFLTSVIGSDSTRVLLRQVQHHLFALVCIQLPSVTPHFGIALAQLISVVTILIGKSCLADLSYLPISNASSAQHCLVKTIFDCLSLRDGLNVRCSVRFALHILCSLKIARDEGYWLNDRTMEIASDSDDISSTQNGAESILHRFITKPLLSLLQWILTVPWRLLAHTEVQYKNIINEEITQDAAIILRTAALMLSSDKLYRQERRSLREWLRTEGRCGWGRPNAVRKVLGTFQVTGMEPTTIIGEASLFLAVESTSTGRNADWILQGALMYADETPLVDNGTGCELGEDEPTLSEMVASCIKHHGAEAGLRMLSTLSMRTHWYFGMSTEFRKADSHISDCLIPTFWPLPPHCLRYVLRSLEYCKATPNGEGGGCVSEVYLISNICMQWDSFTPLFEEWRCRSAQLQSLIGKAEQVKTALNTLDEWSALGNERSTQIPVWMNETLSRVAETNARALGMSLSLSCGREILSNVGGVESAVKRVSGIVSGLSCCVSSVSAVDVIDVAIYVMAMGPFLYRFVCGEEHDGVLKGMDGMMRVLMEERLRLWGVCAPYWARERLGSRVVAEDDYREIVGEGLGSGRAVEEIGENVAVCVCVGRVFGSLVEVEDDQLRSLAGEAGGGRVEEKVVGNVLSVYKLVSKKWVEEERGKMSKAAFRRAVKYCESLRKKLMEVVSRFITMAPRGPRESGSGMPSWLDQILAEFEECAEEVRMYLRAQGVV